MGVPLCQGTLLLPLSAFLLGLPGEGAFPAFLWSDLVSQYQRCAVPAMRPRSQRALAQLHRGSGLPGSGVVGDLGGHPGRQQEWWVTRPMGTLAFGEV